MSLAVIIFFVFGIKEKVDCSTYGCLRLGICWGDLDFLEAEEMGPFPAAEARAEGVLCKSSIAETLRRWGLRGEETCDLGCVWREEGRYAIYVPGINP